MSMCLSRASAAIVQQVPPAAADWFVEWQRKVSAVAETFDGYQGTDVYPPTGGHGNEWVAIVHFEDDESLERWINSPERAQWVDKLHAEVGEFELKTLQGRIQRLVCRAEPSRARAVPPWKMATTVLLRPLSDRHAAVDFCGRPTPSVLGLAFSMLIGNALSVALLQWLVVPALELPLGPWLKANAPSQKAPFAGPAWACSFCCSWSWPPRSAW